MIRSLRPFFLLPFLGACGGDFTSLVPTVQFSRFDVKDIDFEHIETDFVFNLDNPNPIGMPLSRFSYDLALQEVPFLSGDDPNGLALVANGTSEVALPVSLTFEGIYELIQAVRGEDVVGFDLAGGFGFDTALAPVDISYAESGDFPALRIPKLQLGKLRLVSADLEAVDLELDFDLENDHGSALDFANLDFDLAFAGVRVGGGIVEEVGSVEGASSKTFKLPFAIDYFDAITAVAAAASGEKLRVNIDAAMDVTTPFGVLPLMIDETGDISVEQ